MVLILIPGAQDSATIKLAKLAPHSSLAQDPSTTTTQMSHNMDPFTSVKMSTARLQVHKDCGSKVLIARGTFY